MSSTREHVNPRVNEVEAIVRERIKDETALVQLDALLSAYVNVAIQCGRLPEASEVLVQLGGTLLFRQHQVEVARCSVPASLEADHHGAPPIVH
jgi:hypothetical protein